MGKYQHKTSVTINQIFEDLEKLKEFCCYYGFRYSEADLYNSQTYIWRQYLRKQTGKDCRNNWLSARFNPPRVQRVQRT